MNRSGFSLVESLLGVGLLAVGSIGLMSLADLSNQGTVQGEAVRVSMGVRTLIDASLNNPKAWSDTVAHNSSLSCATQYPGCQRAPTGGYAFVIFDHLGNKITYDPLDSTTRYTLTGDSCPSGTSDPSSKCPIKFEAHWTPRCLTYPCMNPTLEITADLKTDFGLFSKAVLNPKNYSFSTVRGLQENDVKSACLILNGTYNILTNTCRPKYANQSCASLGFPNQVVSDVHSDGTITCTPPMRGNCGASEYMNGIDGSGNAICAPMVCSCKYTLSWSACSAPCGGGTQTSIITVSSPATNGGAACPTSTTQSCNTQACSSSVWNVGNWSSCSATCGGGTQSRTVTCEDSVTHASLPASSCASPQPATTQACNTLACTWNYGGWSTCSAACGAGTQTRTATCYDPNSSTNVAAGNCTSGAATSQSCTGSSCGTNCVGSWSACSASCGSGTQTYHITTAQISPGTACPNAEGDTQACNLGACSSCPSPNPGGAVCCGGTWSSPRPSPGTYIFCGCGNSPEWWHTGPNIPNGC